MRIGKKKDKQSTTVTLMGCLTLRSSGFGLLSDAGPSPNARLRSSLRPARRLADYLSGTLAQAMLAPRIVTRTDSGAMAGPRRRNQARGMWHRRGPSDDKRAVQVCASPPGRKDDREEEHSAPQRGTASTIRFQVAPKRVSATRNTNIHPQPRPIACHPRQPCRPLLVKGSAPRTNEGAWIFQIFSAGQSSLLHSRSHRVLCRRVQSLSPRSCTACPSSR